MGILSMDSSRGDITKAARHKDRLHRVAAVMHPKATKATIQFLMDDSEECIRQQVTARLAAM